MALKWTHVIFLSLDSCPAVAPANKGASKEAKDHGIRISFPGLGPGAMLVGSTQPVSIRSQGQ